MTSSKRLDDALLRLAAALDALETTVARRLEAELSHADLEEELAVMQDDRSRLALELDAALAHESALEKARDEVLTRLDRTSDGIRAVLGDDAPSED
ncbi:MULTISPECIES: DUF4164 family protein [Methylosinus]|jgi:hypothetical protein|uniref:DUF4164 domain-containing protein n=1 Tax=Methylosinus trichosporium (strain ATCC 35070 / NCIMB 11131 / UNIQEM 75 / OB3b) TaxID=595536 RepID=A0A2D2D0L4_METT3|nr:MULTISPECIES: DUF4164 family protein [Methylosinus]ATQ68502.1 DUF4164 domain-containing protein [Methylosinus trichosporium OB3b]OBS53966.1 hypothetical protein A8B73_03145 [Methylosinus sp. 3S-1]